MARSFESCSVGFVWDEAWFEPRFDARFFEGVEGVGGVVEIAREDGTSERKPEERNTTVAANDDRAKVDDGERERC